MGTRGPFAVVVGAALLAVAGTWHTLSQDFGVALLAAGGLAVLQAAPLVTALRWPWASWVGSVIALLVATVVVRRAGPIEGLWPDPNLYVHLGVMFLASLRLRTFGWLAMWAVLVGAAVAMSLVGTSTDGSPGLAETIGLATVTVVVAGALARAQQARDDAVVRLVERDRSIEAERVRAALLEERARIARELHDVVAHHMSVVAVQAEAAPLRMVDPPPAATTAFAVIRDHAVEGLTELRRVVGLLRAADDGGTTPQPGLAHLTDLAATVRATGMPVDLVVQGRPRPLTPGLELSVYRIVQESLNNAMRHAPGSSVEVELCYRDDELEATVRNSPSEGPGSGSGLAPAGHGVLGMRERAAMLDGRLDVGASPDGGYRVTAVLPTDDPGGS